MRQGVADRWWGTERAVVIGTVALVCWLAGVAYA